MHHAVPAAPAAAESATTEGTPGPKNKNRRARSPAFANALPAIATPAVLRAIIGGAIVAGANAFGNNSLHLPCGNQIQHDKFHLRKTQSFAPDHVLADVTAYDPECTEEEWPNYAEFCEPQSPQYQHPEVRKAHNSGISLTAAINAAKVLAHSVVQITYNAVPALAGFAPTLWLQDTGSGNDLIARHQCDEFTFANARLLDRPLKLNTASGETRITQSIPSQIAPTLKNAEALLLEDRPAVMSIGLRCVDKGYGFH